MNHLEVRVIGMSRSGNHALVEWILAQQRGRFCFLNCAEARTNPFRTARPLRLGGPVHRTNLPGFSLEDERRGLLSDKDLLVHGYEDAFLGPLVDAAVEWRRDAWVGRSRRRIDLLVVRDPFNLFASRARAGLLRGHHTHHAARPLPAGALQRIYKQHAREALGTRRVLESSRIVVRYDEWVRSRSFRERLANALELEFDDRGIDDVPACGGGSSFDGLAYRGRARQMDVFGRWRAYVRDEAFRALFDGELVELARRLFGVDPALDAWLGLGARRPAAAASVPRPSPSPRTTLAPNAPTTVRPCTSSPPAPSFRSSPRSAPSRSLPSALAPPRRSRSRGSSRVPG